MRTALVAVALTMGTSVSTAQPKVIDLGHPMRETDPSWSGEPGLTTTVVATAEKDGYFLRRFASEEHFGTHLDAPAHFAAGGLTVDQIPVDRLVRPGICIKIQAAAERDEDYRLSLADVKAFEARAGAIPEGSVVLVATGWDRRWPDAARYMNARSGVKHFPGLSVDAADYLARIRRVAGIGIDTPSIDYGPSTAFEAHQTTMPLGVYHIENAANLTSLPDTGFTLVVAPINLADGSGGPTRLFALLP